MNSIDLITCPVCAAAETHVDGPRVIRGPDEFTTRVEVCGWCEYDHGWTIAYLSRKGTTSISVSSWDLDPEGLSCDT
jgi:hypothetical protein